MESTRTVCHPPLFLIIYIRCHHCGCSQFLYYIWLTNLSKIIAFVSLSLRAKSAKKLEPSDDSNFNTLGVCSLPCDRPQTPLGRKGKHACFSKADAKVRQKNHICKYFAKKHAFLAKNSPIVQYKDCKQWAIRVKNHQKLSKNTMDNICSRINRIKRITVDLVSQQLPTTNNNSKGLS